MSNAKKSPIVKPKPIAYDSCPPRAAAAAVKAPPTDFDRLKSVACQLLRRLETSLKKTSRTADGAIDILQKKHDLLFGAKSSHISALATLTELILKLEQAKMKMASGAGDFSYQGDALSDADLALVEAFVQRMKNQS